ncbi:MAG TPA: DUF4097 family beta strand repeat-containing protein [Thermoanaerobaculia bacterium]|nr:DUF4097 family beta strand repeat-containing protein [Thermoanaerobaculia bacterium]
MSRTNWSPAVCAVTLLLAAASPVLAIELEKRLDQTYDLGGGGEVAVSNVNGAVVVEGWDRDVVRVQAVKKARAGSRARAEEALERIEVRVHRTGDRLEIRTRRPDSSSGFLSWVFGNHSNAGVSYTVSVPRRTDVEVATVNGKILVRGLEGAVEVDTTNGGIEVEDVRGSVDAGTTNGAIRVALQAVGEGRPMRFSTTNGAIQLSLPRSAQVSLDASTTNGGIDLDGFPADIRSRSRRHLRADVNGGGPEIELSTTNGGIKVTGR